MTTNATNATDPHPTATATATAPTHPHSHDRLPVHEPRMAWASVAPDIYRAMSGLEQAVRQGIDPVLYELVKIRASQINHCSVCLDMHTKEALAAGESVERIVQLSAWEESRHFYSAKEIAAFELTEAVTVLTDGFVPDEVYGRAAAYFDETELAYLISAITVINAWNRFGVSTRTPPGYYAPKSARK
ncbi:carboxymuconolactone decarboxylase family protein [Streptomyces sp. NPDC051217]|uniref:carboxymuconolactone decarboxylase family protein n=1 Tax=Streptomyces sp. NPDC051217 TaxID=3365644 RepID=UPI0037A544C6